MTKRRKLLLSIDPLAALAENDTAALDELRRLTETSSDALNNLWRSIDAATALHETAEEMRRREPVPPPAVPEQYFVLVECSDEAEQLALLEALPARGPLLSRPPELKDENHHHRRNAHSLHAASGPAAQGCSICEKKALATCSGRSRCRWKNGRGTSG